MIRRIKAQCSYSKCQKRISSLGNGLVLSRRTVYHAKCYISKGQNSLNTKAIKKTVSSFKKLTIDWPFLENTDYEKIIKILDGFQISKTQNKFFFDFVKRPLAEQELICNIIQLKSKFYLSKAKYVIVPKYISQKNREGMRRIFNIYLPKRYFDKYENARHATRIPLALKEYRNAIKKITTLEKKSNLTFKDFNTILLLDLSVLQKWHDLLYKFLHERKDEVANNVDFHFSGCFGAGIPKTQQNLKNFCSLLKYISPKNAIINTERLETFQWYLRREQYTEAAEIAKCMNRKDLMEKVKEAKLDLYDVLGVSRYATTSEITKVYRKLAQKYHPDYNPNDKKAENMFLRITNAFEILSNSDKRYDYDYRKGYRH